jgi:hypothetical protein
VFKLWLYIHDSPHLLLAEDESDVNSVGVEQTSAAIVLTSVVSL